MPIIKAIETAILVMIAVYKGVKWAIEEIRSQRVSSRTLTDSNGVDRSQLE